MGVFYSQPQMFLFCLFDSGPFGIHMSSCGPPLFLWQKIENALFVRVFIYCEEMEKEGQRPSSQTVLGKKRNKASSQISSGVWAWQKRQMNLKDGLVCLLYLHEKKEHLDGFLPLSYNLTSLYSTSFVSTSLSPDCFCSPAISSFLPFLLKPLFLFTPIFLS